MYLGVELPPCLVLRGGTAPLRNPYRYGTDPPICILGVELTLCHHCLRLILCTLGVELTPHICIKGWNGPPIVY